MKRACQWKAGLVAMAILFCWVLPVFAGSNPVLDESTLTFSSGGTTPWFVQTTVNHDGVDARQSGAISDSQSSWMETTVTGPGAVRYWWKVSSESCCDPLSFSIDGTSQANIRGAIGWQSRAFAVPAGSHTLRWTYSTDGSVLSGANAGWVDEVAFEQGSGIDVTPPATAASPSGGTVSTPQVVTLSANEPATIYYTTNGSEPTTASTHYTSPLTISSTTTLKFFAVDTSGNYELTKSKTYTFDTGAPSTSAHPGGGTYAGTRNVSLSCNDWGMGCASTYYCLGSGCTPSTPYSATISISESGDLRFYSTDKAGNSEEVRTAHYTIIPDVLPPTTIPSNAGGVYGVPMFLGFYCSDGDGSGCGTTLYCLGPDCIPTTTYDNLIMLSDSTVVRFYSRDKSGNDEAVQTASYVLDSTPPETLVIPPGGTYEYAPVISLSCNDGAGAGCADISYCLGSNCNPTTYYSQPFTISDTTEVRFFSRDHVNKQEAIKTVTYTRSAQAKTIFVPADRQTIQAAIDAAYNGDTVTVGPGTYVENLDFKGKAITLQSSNGPDSTIIDGSKSGSVVFIGNLGTSNAVLSGFTLQNGRATHNGGGVNISKSSPTIINNKIISNAACNGGGIYVSEGAAVVQGNIVSNNSGYCSGGFGGGIAIGWGGSAQILNNVIENNSMESSDGGGIGIYYSGAESKVIRGNTIKGNRVKGGSPGSHGGGISVIDPDGIVQVVQNLISGNSADFGGGVTWIPKDSTDSVLVNNTIVDNDAVYGSGIQAGQANPGIINNIIVAKDAQPAIYADYLCNLSLRNNIVYSPMGSAYGGVCSDQNGINGNITAAPLFSGPDYYGLRASSPAIDSGNNSPTLPATDLDGMPRIVDGNSDGSVGVDIGAYEFDPTRPAAVLQGIPTEFLTTNSLTISVTGTDVVSYRYALDGDAFAVADIDVATPISLTNLANGQHNVAVLGKNALGREQLLSSATAASWVVNTETSNLTFTTGGSANWFIQPQVSHDGIAYQSGALANNQSSWLETTVTGPGAIRFWSKSTVDYYSSLSFSIDGIAKPNIGGNDWYPSTFAVPPGSHALRWTYSIGPSIMVGLNAGWVDQIIYEQGSNLDTSPPVTSATPAAGMYGSSRSVTLSCSDGNEGGCSGIYYCLGVSCNPSTLYSGAIVISADTDLRFYSTDNAGNAEVVKTATYTFDKSPPNTSTSLSGGSYSGTRKVSLSCYDSGMGCEATYYCLGSGCTPATPYIAAIAIGSTTDLRFYSVDKGGNNEAVKTVSFTITPDITPPATSSGYLSGTYRPLSVSLSCNDGAGSCDTTYYCLGAGCSPTTPFSSSIPISVSTDLRFYSQDSSGNRETVNTISYTIDANPPVTTPSVDGGIYSAPQNVTLTCSDGTGSGCSVTQYCLSNGCSPNMLYTGPISIPSSAYLSFRSVDAVTNYESTKTERFTILSAPPVTINVPADRASVQAAIDAAKDGDTILVAPGTYVENINFKGKSITVTSSGGPDVTIIDGNRIASVATFSAGEWRTSVLDGFTIRNGTSTSGDGGGGITISYASPVVRNCKVINNTACHGVGIYVSAGAPLIQGNVIADNQQSGCITGQGGGGVYLGWATGTELIDNTISGNVVPGGSGGGIFSNGTGKFLVLGNRILNNTTSGDGGGVAMINTSEPEIIQNVISGNRSARGGGVYWSIPASFVGISLINNSIIDNIAPTGAGIFAGGFDANALLINNIFTSTTGQKSIHCEGSYGNLPPQFSNNVVYSPGGGAYSGICTDQNGINGNITADPLLSNSSLGYYGLLAGSPAIDAGDNSVQSLPVTDFGGMTRIIDGNIDGTATVDIGAYEFDPARPVATLQGIPTEFLATNTLTITVGGVGVVSYRYSLDGGAFTAVDIAVATPISLANLPNGQHSIVVLGKNSAGSEQLLSSPTAATWVVNTETTNLTFTNGGNAPWFIQPLVSRDGIAYQSGAIINNQSSWMETTVTGPGAIRFWWKTSPQDTGDSLMFSIDGVSQSSIDSDVDWQNKAYALPSGSHTLRWTYSAGSYGSSSSRAGWIDQITFEPGSNIDVTPPITSATPGAGIYGTPRNVTLSCSDVNGSGCSGIFYCTGSGCNPITPYDSPIIISSATDLRFYSTDLSGNYEPVKTATYSFDTTPPVTAPNYSSGTYSPMSVYLSCADVSGSGCAATYYCLGVGCSPSTRSYGYVNISSSTDLRYYSVDSSGNSETVKTASYRIIISPPVVTTGYALSVSATGAAIFGNVNRNGADTSVTFEYGLTTGYGNSWSGGTLTSGIGALPVSTYLSGLGCGTTYHFRVMATNSAGSAYGQDQMFTTSACQVGVCGSANGAAFTTAPITNLCASGTPSAVTGSGPWSWTCSGTNGASSANCSASVASRPAGINVSWQQTGGPYGGYVSDLVIDPANNQTVYAVTRGGLFKSTNGGGNWTVINNGIPVSDVTAFAISTVNSQTLYVGISGESGVQVFKSVDGGASWSAASSGINATSISTIVIDPANGQIVYAETAAGVYKSTDGGTTWNSANTGMSQYQSVGTIAIDPTNSQTLYAGTYGSMQGGLYKSTNGGDNWSAVYNSATYTYTKSIAIANAQTVYAALYGAGIIKSTDGGTSWTTINNGLTSTDVRSVAIDPANSQIVYAATIEGIFKSTDGGTSWTPLYTGLSGAGAYKIAIDRNNSQTFYVARYPGGILKTIDGGASWTAVNNGLIATAINAISIDPANGQTVYAGTCESIFKTTDGGITWTAINNGVTNLDIAALVIDPRDGQTLYAGTWGGGLFKTVNGGNDWVAVNSGLTSQDVIALAIDPDNSQILYAGTSSWGLFKTTNGGTSWSAINNGMAAPSVSSVVIDPTNSQTVYAGGWARSAIFKSTDGGASWTVVNSGITSYVNALVIDSANSQTLYAASPTGLFKTTNGGATWVAINNGLASTNVYTLIFDPGNSQTLYAGTWGGGTFMSIDGGSTWAAIDSGLPYKDVVSFAIDPTNRQTVYAGIAGGGIFKTVTNTKTITGTVTHNGSGLAGVTFSGADCTTTDSTGAYSCNVPPGWSGTITPISAGITFTPSSRNFVGIVSDLTTQDFTSVTIFSDTSKPVMDIFTMPAFSTKLTVENLTVSASDNVGVTGYLLSESATVPAASASGWSVAAPSSYTFSSAGSKMLYAFARDAAGNVSLPKEATVTIDMTPPQLVLSTLPDGAITNKNTLNIAGSVGDSSGIASLLVNTIAITINPDGSFSHAVSLVPGDNVITTVAADAAGNTVSDIRTVRLDQTAPPLEITTPADNGKTPQALATVSGTVGESATVVVKSTLNGSQNAVMDGNGFSVTVNLESGLNTIDVIATDLAGNSTSVKRSVTYDPLKPSLAVTSPDKDVTIPAGKITISGTVDGTISGIADLVVIADGKEYHPGFTGGSFTQELSFSDEKLYPVIVTAIDEAGNGTSVTRNVIYLKGTIVINGGALYTTSPKVLLSLGYYPAAAQMQFNINGEVWSKPETYATTRKVVLPKGDGLKTVVVRYLDDDGSILGEYGATITLDTRLPSGSMIINGGGRYTNSRTVNLEITATDATSGIAGVCLKESSLPCGDGEFEPFVAGRVFTITAPGDGKKTVYATLRDLAGKTSKPIKASVILDTVAPNGRVVVNGGKAVTGTQLVTIKLKADKASEMMLSLDGGVTWGGWEKFVTSKKVTLVAGAEKLVHVRFRDLAGNDSGVIAMNDPNVK